MESRVTDEYPYTGEDIERVTDGYVNSGVLRMWVSQGWLKAGGRAKSIRGGPRTFARLTVFKAALMAKLRKHGASMATSQDYAEFFVKNLMAAKKLTATAKDQTAEERATVLEDIAKTPFYFVIKPDSGTVFSIPVIERDKPLYKIIDMHGPIILVIDIIEFMRSVMAVLDAGESVDVPEEGAATE